MTEFEMVSAAQDPDSADQAARDQEPRGAAEHEPEGQGHCRQFERWFGVGHEHGRHRGLTKVLPVVAQVVDQQR